jgi:lysylphosphatidylglycerol synthetase-like protein (DUF2156 family)
MAKLRNLFDAFADRRLPKIQPSILTPENRLALCRSYGDFSLAYSTAVQPDLSYFGDEDGYIAYASKMGYIFVLGDPVTAPSNKPALIRSFLAAAGAVCFVQIGRTTAEILAEHGYRINHIGVDTQLALQTHCFAGKRNETIRYSERWLLKSGFSIVECGGHGTAHGDLDKLSSSWRAERIVRRREMRFLNRPFLAARGMDMRRFLLLSSSCQAVAVLDFDPIFRDGNVMGYTTAFKRKMSGTTPHAEVGLTKFAADRFREEGHSVLTFGLSPLANITESGFAESKIWRNLFRVSFSSKRINAKFFNLKGQAAFKRRFHGDETASYIAFKWGTLPQMIALLRLMKAI